MLDAYSKIQRDTRVLILIKGFIIIIIMQISLTQYKYHCHTLCVCVCVAAERVVGCSVQKPEEASDQQRIFIITAETGPF